MLTISQENWTFVTFVGNNTMWVLASLEFLYTVDTPFAQSAYQLVYLGISGYVAPSAEN